MLADGNIKLMEILVGILTVEKYKYCEITFYLFKKGDFVFLVSIWGSPLPQCPSKIHTGDTSAKF